MPARTSVLLIALLACNGEQDAPRTQSTPAAARDAGAVVEVTPDASAAKPPATSSQFHLDPGASTDTTAPTPARRPSRRRIRLTLRSTPTGARVWIDNLEIGTTPTFYELVTTGRPHRFTFVLEGYSMETYRFVPVTDGVVHGTLSKIAPRRDDARPAAPASPEAPKR